MRKFLIALSFIIAGIIALGAFKAYKKSAEGDAIEVVVVDETPCPTDHVKNDMGECVPVGNMDVPNEDEVVAEEPVVMEPVFTPLDFNGKKLNDFANMNEGRVVKLEGPYATAIVNLGLDNFKKKGVIVDGDLYFATKDGGLYVIHGGELINLN